MNLVDFRTRMLWIAVLVAGVLAIYLPGIQNELVFDDELLSSGQIWRDYGSLAAIKQRLLSYGSFVWIDALIGEGWWKQRVVNLLIHVGVVAGLLALHLRLMAQVRWPDELRNQEGFERSRNTAVFVGVAVCAFNPVAVYAVAYLVQRSILMATLFVVLACLFFVRGVLGRSVPNYLVALLCYVAAVLSKEHAIMAPALAVALLLFLKRPSLKQVAVVGGAGLVGVAVVAAVLIRLYGSIIGVAFDELSVVYVDQLKAIDPEVESRIYPLSIINQIKLFFIYGFFWVLPVVSWMSIDMRPPFPLSMWGWQYLAAAVAFVALAVGSAYLLVKRDGPLRYLGLCLSFPLLLFVSEFATVWVQDPLVLYRSYLWAIALPGLIALMLVGMKPKTLYLICFLVSAVLIALSLERVHRFRTPLSVWTDAVEKIAADAPDNAVGRWRPLLNRANYYLEHDMLQLAYADFVRAEALGELRGTSSFGLGVTLQQMKRLPEALAAFQRAEQRGTRDGGLYYHRGATLAALGRHNEAVDDLALAIEKSSDPKVRNDARVRRGDSAMTVRRFDIAVHEYGEVVNSDPAHYEVKLGLAIALLGQKDLDKAGELLERLIAEREHDAAFYGRALLRSMRGQTADALADLDRAIALNPRHPGYPQLRAQIAGSGAVGAAR